MGKIKIYKIIKFFIRKTLTIQIKKLNIKFILFIIKFFPKEKFWLISRLINKGYLNLSVQIIDNNSLKPKNHEQHIVDRIISMNEIKTTGLIIKNPKKNSINSINILFAVHNSLPYDKAGYAIRTHSIVTNLKKNSLNVTVATRAGYPWDLQKHRELDKQIKEDCIDGIRYLRLLDDNKTFKRGADFEYIKTYADELIKTAKENAITILHAHSNYLNALSAIEASNKLGIPSIYEIRGLWHLTRLTVDESYKYNGMFEYEQEMVKGAAMAADAVVTISEALKSLIVSWGVDDTKITVIPNAVDTSLLIPQSKSTHLIEKYNLKERVVIGFIGSITAYEGLEYLISAVDELVSDGYNLSLLIVGDGKEKDRFQKLAKSKEIIFTGRVPHSDVKEYYSISDMCVYPRNNHEVCQYVPPLKPLEAMAMKKAVIVSDVAPMLEMVKDNITGLVSQADNKDSLKEKIILLYNDETLRNNLAKNASKWINENRTWNIVVKKYIKLYNSFK